MGSGENVARRKIEFQILADWAEGRLSETESRMVEEGLAEADEDTLAAAGWLRAFYRVSEDLVLDEPPAGVREELTRRFEDYAEGRRQTGSLRRLVATLAFEGGEAAFGMRSAAARESQGQLVYTTGAADIALDLRRRPENGSLDLDGQIFPTDGTEPDAFGVQLLSGADEVGTTATDELGEFSFQAVAPGEYQILISSGRVEILISPVDLGT
jgi:hypothetical protein